MRRLLMIPLLSLAAVLLLAANAPGADAAGTWRKTSPLMHGRWNHTATGLVDGRVLIVGGSDSHATSEIFDPRTRTFAAAAAPLCERYRHAATLLPDGRVLVSGGLGDCPNGPSDGSKSAEIYDPGTDSWSITGSMAARRIEHAAVLMQDGRVMALGGANNGSGYAEVFDPATGAWTATDSLAQARNEQMSVTVLQDGRILVAGGIYQGETLATAETFDPVTGYWTLTGAMTTARRGHIASLLPDGRVLVAGGRDSTKTILASAEIFDPATGTWSATAAMADARTRAEATVLSDGRVLVVGTDSDESISDKRFALQRRTEIFDPATGTWSAGGSLAEPRLYHTVTALADGRVLVAGTFWGDNRSAELYDPS